MIVILGVVSLACTLSCNGNEGAAVVVGVLGIDLVIFLMTLAFKGIGKRKKKEVEKNSEVASL